MSSRSYTTEDLVHFVGAHDPAADARNWETLRMILASGAVLAGGKHGRHVAVLERNLGKTLSSNERYLPSMSCFADIPHDLLDIHVRKYGPFGLALRKRLLTEQGVRPVFYVPRRAATGAMATKDTMQAEWDELLELIEVNLLTTFGGRAAPSDEDQSRIDEWLEFQVLAYVKFFDIGLPPEDPRNVYMEREWRSVGGIDFELPDLAQVFVAPGYRAAAEGEFPSLVGSVTELA